MKFKAYILDWLGDYTHLLVMNKSFFTNNSIKNECKIEKLRG